LRLSSFGGYRLALAALALVLFGAYDSYPKNKTYKEEILPYVIFISVFSFPLRTIENNHDSLRMSVADFFSLPAFYYFNTARNTRRLKSTKIKRKTNKQTRDHHANTEKLSKGETWMEKTASGGGTSLYLLVSDIRMLPISHDRESIPRPRPHITHYTIPFKSFYKHKVLAFLLLFTE